MKTFIALRVLALCALLFFGTSGAASGGEPNDFDEYGYKADNCNAIATCFNAAAFTCSCNSSYVSGDECKDFFECGHKTENRSVNTCFDAVCYFTYSYCSVEDGYKCEGDSQILPVLDARNCRFCMEDFDDGSLVDSDVISNVVDETIIEELVEEEEEEYLTMNGNGIESSICPDNVNFPFDFNRALEIENSTHRSENESTLKFVIDVLFESRFGTRHSTLGVETTMMPFNYCWENTRDLGLLYIPAYRKCFVISYVYVNSFCLPVAVVLSLNRAKKSNNAKIDSDNAKETGNSENAKKETVKSDDVKKETEVCENAKKQIGDPDTYQIFVKLPSGLIKVFAISQDWTVQRVKEAIHDYAGVPPSMVVLKFNKKKLCDTQPLCEIPSGSTLEILMRIVGGVNPSSSDHRSPASTPESSEVTVFSPPSPSFAPPSPPSNKPRLDFNSPQWGTGPVFPYSPFVKTGEKAVTSTDEPYISTKPIPPTPPISEPKPMHFQDPTLPLLQPAHRQDILLFWNDGQALGITKIDFNVPLKALRDQMIEEDIVCKSLAATMHFSCKGMPITAKQETIYKIIDFVQVENGNSKLVLFQDYD